MGNDFVKTPNLDDLAARGTLFTNAFACSPVCSPSRAQIMTGKFSGPPGTRRNVGNLLYKLSLGQTTIAEVLKSEGYATGFIGKWHLSPHGIERRDGFVPLGAARQGFDYWAAVEVPSGHYNAKYYLDTPDPIVARGFSCDVETDLAIRYIDSQKQPFFLVVSWNPPHNPYSPPQKYDIYDPSAVALRPNVPKAFEDVARISLAGYYGLISAVDANVGKIFRSLNALDIAKDTIVFFCSDHGDMQYSQGVRLEDGAKRRPWNESSHVPFILTYPRVVPAGQVHDALIGTVDIAPTLLALAGAPAPAGVQGCDFSPLLLGQSFTERDSIFLHITAGGRTTPLSAPWRGVRTKEWMFAVSAGLERGDWLLYNIREDPFEVNNLVDDPAHHRVKEEMRGLLGEWRRDVGDDLDLREFYKNRRSTRRTA